jgi:hypothetical protein
VSLPYTSKIAGQIISEYIIFRNLGGILKDHQFNSALHNMLNATAREAYLYSYSKLKGFALSTNFDLR